MRPGRANRLATWAVSVLWTLLAVVPAGGLSVCLGADGHFWLGQVSELCACPCELPNEEGGADHADTGRGESPPCTDLTLELPEFVLNKGASQDDDAGEAVTAPPLAATMGAVLPARDPGVHAQRPPPAERLPSLALRQRSTVVLLI